MPGITEVLVNVTDELSPPGVYLLVGAAMRRVSTLVNNEGESLWRKLTDDVIEWTDGVLEARRQGGLGCLLQASPIIAAI